ncbi:MAG: UDP-N-acetylmuramate dehydrogenase [Colwellia sp.]
MYSCQQVSLQARNSFNVEVITSQIYQLHSIDDLTSLPDFFDAPFYILGEGSNTLFVDQKAPIILNPQFLGMSFVEADDHYIVTVGAGENWHQLVCFCIDQGINGLENLALIPGSVGAAPVQNIGAYGAEFSNFCREIQWYEFSTKSIKTLSQKACQFSYRNSIFKQAYYNQGLITQVSLSIPKKWQANLSYAGLDELSCHVTAKEVMAQVVKLRQAKLPDPTELPNAGSFFKNPLVSNKQYQRLKKQYPNMPAYPQHHGEVKLAAGWLIEQAGLKGFRYQQVGVHQKQALVLVNYGSLYGADIVSLAKWVQQKVQDKFNITIMPEVRLVTQQGELNFTELVAATPIPNNESLDGEN